ncbi:MAG TPA: hypothetical protein PLD25_12680 [Chloroflexota bacterium]|nr:hypothetical protein [Chloroflexota bacterium]HUM70266.1 hypothetical protein [Chloroflexota bacterium]
MIVLDENIWNPRMEDAFRVWYRGQVISINALRPITLIKDDSIPQLLHRANYPTFITINATDFWRRVPAHRGYCIVTFPFPHERLDELPELSRQLFRLREFASKGTRMGKIVQVTGAQIMYYGLDRQLHRVGW